MTSGIRLSLLIMFLFIISGCGGGGGSKIDDVPPVWVNTVGITKAMGGPGSITVEWGKAKDPSGVSYRLYAGITEDVWSRSGLNFETNDPVTFTGLIPGQIYWFGVRAIDRAGSKSVMAASVVPFSLFQNNSDKSLKSIKDNDRTLIAMDWQPIEHPNEDKNTRVLSATPNGLGELMVRTWSGSGNYAVKIDHSGNKYAVGSFTSQSDFNGGLFNPVMAMGKGWQDAFLAKFNHLGRLEWVRTWGSDWNDIAYDLAVDSSDNIYVTGIFTGAVDFDPGDGVDIRWAIDSEDIFLLKFSSDGTRIWAKTLGGPGWDRASRVCFDPAGYIIVAGKFQQTVDFDPGPGEYLQTTVDSGNAFFSKFDLDGNWLLTGTWGGLDALNADEAFAVGCDNYSNIYLAGKYYSTADLNPGMDIYEQTSNGLSDAYLIKLDQYGTFLWSRSFGGPYDDCINDLALDQSGNVYVTGNYLSPIDFAQGSGAPVDYASHGKSDVFLSKYSSSGDHIWTRTWGGASAETGNRVVCDMNGNIHVLSNYNTAIYFDPPQGQNNIPEGSCDKILLCRFNPDGNLVKFHEWGSLNWYSGGSRGFGLDIDPLMNISIVGTFSGYVDFDSGDGFCFQYYGNHFLLTITPGYQD